VRLDTAAAAAADLGTTGIYAGIANGTRTAPVNGTQPPDRYSTQAAHSGNSGLAIGSIGGMTGASVIHNEAWDRGHGGKRM
jgi:hypothetical protein